MKREQIIESLVNQFAENITNLSDETLKDVESGNLVISLTPAVDKEAGGRSSGDVLLASKADAGIYDAKATVSTASMKVIRK